MVKEDGEDGNKTISETWVGSNNICDIWRF
jgi:hypothetical protein